MWFQYESPDDPYRERGTVPEPAARRRVFFAADPADRIAVVFGDLPQPTREALEPLRARIAADLRHDVAAELVGPDEHRPSETELRRRLAANLRTLMPAREARALARA